MIPRTQTRQTHQNIGAVRLTLLQRRRLAHFMHPAPGRDLVEKITNDMVAVAFAWGRIVGFTSHGLEPMRVQLTFNAAANARTKSGVNGSSSIASTS